MLRVITSHENLDFDGFASMIASSKIYPNSTMVFSGKLNKAVREFYSLYKNVLSMKQASEIDHHKVRKMIIVDTNSMNRLGKFKDLEIENIDITIYDHHLETEDTIKLGKKMIEPYGSCTSILLKEIIKKEITITPFEATIFLLGIYSDTNCLTFSSTTPEDAEVVSYLLRKGADLEVVAEYMKKSLSDEHHQLFLSLLLNMESIEINNYKIILSTYQCDTYIGELSYIANKMLELKDCDAVFLMVEMEKRYYIVGRSSEDTINIPFILEEFKGGGHVRAASATLKVGQIEGIEKIKEILIKGLKERIKPQITAKDIMNYPVKTITQDITIEEASKIMLRYGHTGIPVVKRDELIGMISRTDIDKATIHGLIHAPVKGFMKREVITVGPDTALSTINDLLVNNNIGRLPVVEDGKIIGIVTRTDLLRKLYGKNQPYWYRKNYSAPKEEFYCYEKIKNLPASIYSILKTIGEAGDRLSTNVFIVGGFVRDLLIDAANYDLDIVVEGDGITFATELNKKLDGQLVVYEKFATASIKLEDGSLLDIVSARREYYQYPAALPEVEKSSLWNDLFRRDFTLNCMAIQLNHESFGKLIDYFGGVEDIRKKKIRVLYNLSFVEDPTRIFRAIRFACRLNFEIERETKHFIVEAVKNNLIMKLSNDRIREEITQIITEGQVHRSVALMKDLNVLKALHDNLHISNELINKLKSMDSAIDNIKGAKDTVKIDRKLIVVLHLLIDFPLERLSEVIDKFIPNKVSIEEVRVTLQERDNVYAILRQEELDRFVLYKTLKRYGLESLIFFYNDSQDSYIRHYITYYMLHLTSIKTHLTGRDLLSLNIAPGPLYGEIFDKLLEAKVKGKVYDKKDEIQYAKDLYEKLKEREDV